MDYETIHSLELRTNSSTQSIGELETITSTGSEFCYEVHRCLKEVELNGTTGEGFYHSWCPAFEEAPEESFGPQDCPETMSKSVIFWCLPQLQPPLSKALK